MMTFPTIAAGTRANEAIGGYANFVAYCNALAAGVDSVTTTAAGAALKANNLSDIASAETARQNLGLGTMATATASDYLSKAGNLGGIADPAAARTNLGLGTMATQTASAYATLAGATFTGAAAIVGSADTTQFRVRGHSTQTADFVRVENSAGTKIGGWDRYGQLNTQYLTDVTGVSPYLRLQTNSLVAINQGNAANNAFAIRGMAAQAGHLLLCETSSSIPVASISANGTGTFAGVSCGSFVNGATNPYLHLNSNRNGVGVINRDVITQIPFHVQGMAGQTGNLTNWLDGSAVTLASVTAAGLHRWDAAANQQTTVGAAGGASALPGTPTKYLKVVDSTGATLVIPAYAPA